MPKVQLELEIQNGRVVQAELQRTADGVARLGRDTEDAGRKAGGWQRAMEYATGQVLVSGAARLRSFVSEQISATDALAKGAKRSSMSTAEYQRLAYAAQMSGSNMAELGTAIRTMQMYVAKGSPEIEQLGFNLSKLKGLEPDRMFARAAEEIARIEDPTRRTAIAMGLMGDSGSNLLPMIDNLRQLRQEADQLGIVMEKSTLQAAERFNDEMTRLKMRARAGMMGGVEYFANADARDLTGSGLSAAGGAILGGMAGGGAGAAAGATVGTMLPMAAEKLFDKALERIMGDGLSNNQWGELQEINRRQEDARNRLAVEQEIAAAKRMAVDAQLGAMFGDLDAQAKREAWSYDRRDQAKLAARLGRDTQATALRQAADMGEEKVTELGQGDIRIGFQILEHDAARAKQAQEQAARDAEQIGRDLEERLAQMTKTGVDYRIWQHERELAAFKGTAAQRAQLVEAQEAEIKRMREAAAAEQLATQRRFQDRLAGMMLEQYDYQVYLLDRELADFQGTEQEKLLFAKAIDAEKRRLDREEQLRKARDRAMERQQAQQAAHDAREQALAPTRALHEAKLQEIREARQEAREKQRLLRLAASGDVNVARGAPVTRRQRLAMDWREAAGGEDNVKELIAKLEAAGKADRKEMAQAFAQGVQALKAAQGRGQGQPQVPNAPQAAKNAPGGNAAGLPAPVADPAGPMRQRQEEAVAERRANQEAAIQARRARMEARRQGGAAAPARPEVALPPARTLGDLVPSVRRRNLGEEAWQREQAVDRELNARMKRELRAADLRRWDAEVGGARRRKEAQPPAAAAPQIVAPVAKNVLAGVARPAPAPPVADLAGPMRQRQEEAVAERRANQEAAIQARRARMEARRQGGAAALARPEVARPAARTLGDLAPTVQRRNLGEDAWQREQALDRELNARMERDLMAAGWRKREAATAKRPRGKRPPAEPDAGARAAADRRDDKQEIEEARAARRRVDGQQAAALDVQRRVLDELKGLRGDLKDNLVPGRLA